MKDWAFRDFHMQAWWEVLADVFCDLYERKGSAAWKRMQAVWPKLERGFLLSDQLHRIEARTLLCRAALAHAREEPNQRSSLLRAADKQCDKLERENAPRGTASPTLRARPRRSVASCHRRLLLPIRFRSFERRSGNRRDRDARADSSQAKERSSRSPMLDGTQISRSRGVLGDVRAGGVGLEKNALRRPAGAGASGPFRVSTTERERHLRFGPGYLSHAPLGVRRSPELTVPVGELHHLIQWLKRKSELGAAKVHPLPHGARAQHGGLVVAIFDGDDAEQRRRFAMRVARGASPGVVARLYRRSRRERGERGEPRWQAGNLNRNPVA